MIIDQSLQFAELFAFQVHIEVLLIRCLNMSTFFLKKSASDSILHGFVLRCAMCIQSSDTFVLCIYPGWFCAFLLDLSPRGPCAGESHPQGREAGGQPLTIFGPH